LDFLDLGVPYSKNGIYYFYTREGVFGALTGPSFSVKNFFTHLFKKRYTSFMEAYVPAIEENIPLPKNAQEAFPNLTPTEELNMRAAVVTLMSELTGQPITPNKENVDEAKAIAKEMITNPQYRPDFSKYPNETLAMLAGMVSQMKVLVVDELAELKTYVVNHLIASVEAAKDVKTKIVALRALGEVDGVDAFKKRTETTIKIQTMEEVENELLSLLDVVEGKYIDVEAKEVVRKERNDS
jgi:hypothetical protein